MDIGGRRSTALARQSTGRALRSEEHTSELQSLTNLVCRPLPEKKKFLAALALPKFRFYGLKAFIDLLIAVPMLPFDTPIFPPYTRLRHPHSANKLSGDIIPHLR